MNILLRALSILLLMAAVLLTLARREHSGWIVYGSSADGVPAIFLMTGDGASVRQVTPGGFCGGAPQWSPDGMWISFSNFCGGNADLLHIRPGGAALEVLTTGIFSAEGREWSHDGQFMGVTRYGRDLYIVKAREGGERLVSPNYVFARWAADNDWIYARPTINGFNRLDRIHVTTGRIEPLSNPQTNLIDLHWSPAAAQYVLVKLGEGGDSLLRMTRDESTLTTIPIDSPPQRLIAPQWSPDGAWIAFLGGNAYDQMHIYRIQPDGGDRQRLTTRMGAISGVDWSPDGEWLLFDANYEGFRNIYRLRADGSSMQRLASGLTPQYAPVAGLDWHPALTIIATGMLFAASFVGKRRP